MLSCSDYIYFQKHLRVVGVDFEPSLGRVVLSLCSAHQKDYLFSYVMLLTSIKWQYLFLCLTCHEASLVRTRLYGNSNLPWSIRTATPKIPSWIWFYLRSSGRCNPTHVENVTLEKDVNIAKMFCQPKFTIYWALCEASHSLNI